MSTGVADQHPGGIFSPSLRWVTLAIIGFVALFAFAYVGVLTALPKAASELNGLRAYGWALNGSIIATLCGTIVAGGWSDRRGPRAPLLAGLLLFGAGLVIAGSAWTFPMLVIGRAFQGAGSGTCFVAIYVAVGRFYPGHARPAVFSAMSSAWVMPALLGPAIAGTVTELFSWRWVFLGTLPLLLPVAWTMEVGVRRVASDLGITTDADVRPAGAAGDPVRRWHLALLVGAGAGLVQLVATAHVAGHVPPYAAAFLVGMGLLAYALPRLVPAGTFTLRRGLPAVVAMRGLLAGPYFAAEAFIPLMMNKWRHVPLDRAGWALSAGGLTWALGSYLQSRTWLRIARWRLVQVGTMISVVAIAIAPLGLDHAWSPYVTAVAWGLGGFGLGLAFASVSVLLFELSPQDSHGVNSSALQMSDAVMSMLCTAAAGAIFAALATHPPGYLAYLLIFLVLTGLGLVGVFAAERVRVSG